jgi:hypothetical protein
MKRRHFFASMFLPLAARAQGFRSPADASKWIAEGHRGRDAREGGIELEMPQIAENGNAVALHIRVTQPHDG